jgi:hypothetical protein
MHVTLGEPCPSHTTGPAGWRLFVLAGLLLPPVAASSDTGEAFGVARGAAAEDHGAASEPAADPKILGRYRFVGGEQQRQRLLDAIEEVVKDMVFLVRPIARRRLRNNTQPSEELHIDVTATQITIVRSGLHTVSAPRDGSSIVWRSPEGDEFAVRHRLGADEELIQEFVGASNHSNNVFRLAAGGSRLTVQTTISDDRLPSALRYHMTYQRQSP